MRESNCAIIIRRSYWLDHPSTVNTSTRQFRIIWLVIWKRWKFTKKYLSPPKTNERNSLSRILQVHPHRRVPYLSGNSALRVSSREDSNPLLIPREVLDAGYFFQKADALEGRYSFAADCLDSAREKLMSSLPGRWKRRGERNRWCSCEFTCFETSNSVQGLWRITLKRFFPIIANHTKFVGNGTYDLNAVGSRSLARRRHQKKLLSLICTFVPLQHTIINSSHVEVRN